jgi:hypothetical protein
LKNIYIIKIFKNTTHKLKYLHTYLHIENIYEHTSIFTNTTNKLKYLHNENIYKHTSTPPPNLKRHIAHNVTKLTKPRGWVNSGMHIRMLPQI